MEVYWWDLAGSRMRQAVASAVDFQAAPNPGLVSEIPLPTKEETAEESSAGEKGWVDMARQWSIPAAVALATLIVLVRYLPRLARRFRARMEERRQSWANSEAVAFDRVRGAVRTGDGRDLSRNLYRWLDRLAPPGRIETLREFALWEGDDAFRKGFELLEAGLFGKQPNADIGLEGRSVYEFVARARCKSRSSSVDLPDLNA